MGTWGHFSSSSRQIHPFPIREWEWADYAQPIDLSHQNFWHSDGPDISKAFEMMPRYSQVSSAASGSDFFSKETFASRRTHHHFILGKNLLRRMVFCYQNCSDLLWEKIVLVIEKNFWNSRLNAKNLQKIWNHWNNLFKQWKVRTIFGNRMLF